LFPPILLPEGSTRMRDVFLNPALINVLKVIFFGRSSLEGNGKSSGPTPSGVKWGLSEVTPGTIALAAVIVRAILSPDTDFAPRGNVTGINYLESFREYKKILSSDPLDPTYQRIFTIFNTSLFGVTATPRADFVLDTSDYNAELRE
ncbi:hypothetical protein BJ322DRAFT_988718, partial [Thelephora terrestris]